MKISASAFTSEKPIEYTRKFLLNNVDYVHLDFIEKNGSCKRQIRHFNRLNVPLDVHLIYKKVSKSMVKKMNNSSVEILNVQYENLENVDKTVENLKEFDKDFGFAITPKTDCSKLLPYKNIMKHILIMCTTPGISGASFLEESYDFVEKIKDMFPGMAIYVDGGMNKEKLEIMREKGASVAVLGSYLYKNREHLEQTVKELS